MKKTVDYCKLRGFNYTQSNVWNDIYFWDNYNHDIVDRDMGYAQRLNLNSARIFLVYQSYLKDKKKFLANVKDFIQTAWAHGISTCPIIYHGFHFLPDDYAHKSNTKSELPPVAKTVTNPSCWHLGEEYFDDLLAAVGDEPGLLFWDISNEPGYTDGFITWYDEEPEFARPFKERPSMEELREKQEQVWKIVRHFCKYVKQKDPDHDIGVGNIFIYETEPSGTAELVDVIIYHDYSISRAQMRVITEQAVALGKKYNKPILNNETCCLCRSNPYDMTLEMLEEYGIGWYVFELMIGEDGWNRVHGIVYPDGSVRDPSIISALFGFYRKRGKGIVMPDVNQEGHVNKLIRKMNVLLENTRRNRRMDHSKDAEEFLELCEYAANMLEAGELVPMNYPPTAGVEAYRRQQDPDVEEIKDWLFEMVTVLKKSCHIL